MKIRFLIVAGLLAFLSEQTIAQNRYRNEPLILAQKDQADILVGKDWQEKRWRISPQIAHDTLKLKLYSSKENVGFRTDKDSIKFKIKVGETKSFYVKMGDTDPAHTLITAEPFVWNTISFSKEPKRKDMRFFFEKPNHAYFDSLRRMYPVSQLMVNDRTDIEKILSLMNWTHHQWKHDGNKSPKRNDAISILNEVREGSRFPCFAYSIVLRDQLMAHGFKARVLYIKTKDAEIRESSPGHVVTEVFVNDLRKWVFLDGQFNVMPVLNGKPLNGVEFQEALSKNYDRVVLLSRDKVDKRGYTDFVYEYLYYFDTALDNRQLTADKMYKIEGKRSVMLVPAAAPNLSKLGIWKTAVDYCVYTHSLNDFYAIPE